MEDRTGFPPHSPCGNASPSSWSGSPPMSGEPPGRRPRSPRIHCDVDTTPHSCGMRGHHPTQLLKPPVGALGPSRSFQAAVGSGNSCQPSAHRLEPEGVELLLAQDLPRLGPARSKNPCAIGLVGKVCQIRIWIDFRAISLWEEVQRGGWDKFRTPQMGVKKAKFVARQPPAGGSLRSLTHRSKRGGVRGVVGKTERALAGTACQSLPPEVKTRVH